MTELVIDASIFLSWAFEDESTPETRALATQVRSSSALIPSLTRTEVANVLVMAERRGRISTAQVGAFLLQFDALPLRMDAPPNASTLDAIVSLARREKLTVYDATYLELALRHGAMVATKDQQLAAAARNLGLVVLP
ncbi:MAG: DNA-binding protein [Caulobacter sp.]|nr:DNA-binding protein [Caulobacter sp.]